MIKSLNGFCSVGIRRRVGGIGDILMCLPAIEHLKKEYPNIIISFGVDKPKDNKNVYTDLLKHNPFIDHVLGAYEMSEKDYDVFIDLTSVCIAFELQGLPIRNRIDMFADAIGIKNKFTNKPWYAVTSEEAVIAKNLIKDQSVISLHTASAEAERNWPLEYNQQLVTRLPNQKFLVFDPTGSVWKQPNVINCSQTTVREMAALIAASDYFIGPDSGPMHLAGTLGVPGLVLFGAIPPEARMSHYPSLKAITADVSCLGCWYAECKYDIKCMKLITVEKVISHLGDYYYGN